MTPEQIREDMKGKCFEEYLLNEGYDWREYKTILEPEFEVHMAHIYQSVQTY